MSTPLPRAEFAVTERFVYLNHASAGVLPRTTVAAIEQFAREHAEGGVRATYPYDLRLPEYRDRIGRYIGAAGAEIALVTNTSVAAATVAAGLKWNAGDEVLLCDNEFPANATAWVALRRRGVAVRLLETRHERLTPQRLCRVMTPRTRLIAVSWVSYADGYRHDLAGLAAVAHEGGALLCVDAMQGLGAFTLDVRELDLDALYAGAPKWLLGLHGIGLLCLGARLRDRLELAMPGWRSVRDIWDFHNYEQAYSEQALRFESGTPNIVGALSLVSAIDLFERSGTAAIAEHVLMLTDTLCEGLHAIGARIASPRGLGVSSGIVTYTLPQVDSIELGHALERKGIITTYRATGVRVSPHGYNTVHEIEALVNVSAQAAHSLAKV